MREGRVNDKEVQRKVGMMVPWTMRDWPLDMCALYFGQVFAEVISEEAEAQ